MHGRLRVEPADLRGWAGQVGRAGEDCVYLADYVTSFAPDGDFGRVLELVGGDYEHFCARAREVLAIEGGRFQAAGAALRHAAADYVRTDTRAARGLDPGAVTTDDGRASPSFRDVAATRPPAPVCGGEVLPQVTLSWGFSQVCDLVSSIGGFDLRRGLTDWVSGDIDKALSQASMWDHAADSLTGVRDNLARGSATVAATWQGEAAGASRDYTDEWIVALGSQSDTMSLVAQYLRDAVEQAVDVAQLVADVVQFSIAVVVGGLGFAYVPIYGQVQVVNKVKDCLRLLLDARKVVLVFWTFLVAMKDAFVGAADVFTAESLPPAVTLPGPA